jgi:uroporphyrinogen-III decarboxylase
MNNRERLLKIYQHEEPDRVLVHHRGILPNGTFYQNWMENVADDLEEEYIRVIPTIGDLTLQTWCGQDTVYGGVPTIVGYPAVKLIDLIGDRPDHPVWSVLKHVPDPSRLTINSHGSIGEHRPLNGLNYHWYHDGFFRTPEIRKEFYEKFGNSAEDKFSPSERHFDTLRKQLKTLEDMNYPVVMICESGSFWEAFFEGHGMGPAAQAMRRNPSYVRTVIDDLYKEAERAWKIMLDAGADVVGIADDLGQKGRGLLSPKQWREFIKPKFSQLMNLAHKRGAFTEMHSCGFIEDFLPDLIDAGLDSIQSLEPAAGVDIARVKDNYGDKMTLIGGIDSTNTMSFGTTADVVADTKKCLKAAMRNGGYLAGTSHRIINVPVENVVAMRDTIKKYGTYPCRL